MELGIKLERMITELESVEKTEEDEDAEKFPVEITRVVPGWLPDGLRVTESEVVNI